MHPIMETILKIAWLPLIIYWLWTARHAKPNKQRQNLAVRFIAYWFPFLIAVALIGPGYWFGDSFLHHRFEPVSFWIEGFGIALVITGVALSIRARYLLGKNWSMSVELKQGHELIQSGPYRVVRHPIYTGLLIAFIGTAIAIGEWRAIISIAVMAVMIVYKIRVEDRWLHEQFGSVYTEYAARTRALVPGL